jgi:hypothetical protein
MAIGALPAGSLRPNRTDSPDAESTGLRGVRLRVPTDKHLQEVAGIRQEISDLVRDSVFLEVNLLMRYVKRDESNAKIRAQRL